MLTEPDPGYNHPPDLLRLLIQLDELSVEPVRHSRSVGLRGPVRSVPAALWAALDRHEAALVRLLRGKPTRFRKRQGWTAA